MWAITDSTAVQSIITSPINVVGNSGATYQDIRLTNRDTRVDDGIYDYTDGTACPKFSYLTNEEFSIDNDNGVVTKNNTYSYKPKAEIFAERKIELKALRNEKLYAGISWNTNEVQTDEISLSRITGLATKALIGNYPGGGIGWRMRDNSTIVLSETDAKNMADVVSDHTKSCYANQKTHEDAKNTLVTSGTQQELAYYDITTGWPTVLAPE